MSTVATAGPTPDPQLAKQLAAEQTKPKDKPQPAAPAAPAAPATPTSATAAPKKLSAAAEAKAKKQAKKAARRAQAIAAKAVTGGPPTGPVATNEAPATQPLVSAGGEGKGAKSKAKQDGPASAPSAGGRKQSGGAAAVQAVKEEKKEAKPAVPFCFSHIPMAKRIGLPEADKDVHPAVLALGQQMAAFALKDSMARLKGTLQAFKEVLRSYEADAPAGNNFSRHFVPHVLNPQIEYLTECRPMCFAMGNAIRQIKTHVTNLDVDISDRKAIETLCGTIDGIIEERINYAEVIVTRNAAAMIADGDVILTYGNHRLVQKALQLARSEGRNFSAVIVADQSNGGANGQDLAKLLHKQGVKVTYVPRLVEIGSLLLPGTKLMLGVESVFANGALYAPAGTSDIAVAASQRGLSVIALSESINVDRDRVAVEPLTYNEIDPDMFVDGGLRLLFDNTREHNVTALVTEYETETGSTPPAAVLAILRKQDDPN